MRVRGFSLTEVMMALAVSAILLAVAVPSYQSHIRSTKRGLATACLIEASQFMERVYSSSMAYNSYNGATTALPELSCRVDLAGDYTMSLTADASTYTLTATPAGGQASDTVCGTLTINQTGARTAKGESSTDIIKKCW